MDPATQAQQPAIGRTTPPIEPLQDSSGVAKDLRTMERDRGVALGIVTRCVNATLRLERLKKESTPFFTSPKTDLQVLLDTAALYVMNLTRLSWSESKAIATINARNDFKMLWLASLCGSDPHAPDSGRLAARFTRGCRTAARVWDAKHNPDRLKTIYSHAPGLAEERDDSPLLRNHMRSWDLTLAELEYGAKALLHGTTIPEVQGLLSPVARENLALILSMIERHRAACNPEIPRSLAAGNLRTHDVRKLFMQAPPSELYFGIDSRKVHILWSLVSDEMHYASAIGSYRPREKKVKTAPPPPQVRAAAAWTIANPELEQQLASLKDALSAGENSRSQEVLKGILSTTALRIVTESVREKFPDDRDLLAYVREQGKALHTEMRRRKAK